MIKNCSITFIIIFFVLSCDVLNQEPEMGVSNDNVIHDEKSAQNAINGLYSMMKETGGYYDGTYLMMSDISSDISQSVGTFDSYIAMDTYALSSTQFMGIGDFWREAYKVINQANNIIKDVPDLSNVDQDIKDQFLGESYFIRALAYFDLNRAFGGVEGVYGSMGVPVIIEPTNTSDDITYPERPSIEETYQQVESDLNKAKDLLSQTDNPVRVSKATAEALLSRLYLYYKQDYMLVEQNASNVINDYDYELTENFADIFINEQTNGSIFELASSSNETSSFYNYYAPASEGGRDEFKLHRQFVDFMNSRPQDDRAKLIEYSDDADIYYPMKYQKEDFSDNVQILRLAEMYLNRAEARVLKASPDLQGALSDINSIRNRAGLSDTTGPGVDTPDEILHAIEVERKAEFFEEGHHWFNLIRTGRAVNVLTDIKRKNGSTVSLEDPGRQVWPIPRRNLNNNKNLEQNPAYE